MDRLTAINILMKRGFKFADVNHPNSLGKRVGKYCINFMLVARGTKCYPQIDHKPFGNWCTQPITYDISEVNGEWLADYLVHCSHISESNFLEAVDTIIEFLENDDVVDAK